MDEITKSKIEALRYAISVCETRKSSIKIPAYNIACDEIKTFLEAAIFRLECGEEMISLNYFQEKDSKKA